MFRGILLATCGAVAVCAVAALAPLPAAAAATSCRRAVLDEWFTGRIATTHPPSCYRDAIRHLPVDARAYTTAASDIERAMLAAIAAQRRRPPKPVLVHEPRRALTGRPTTTRAAATATATPTAVRRADRAPFDRIAAVGTGGGAGRVPIPVVVLSALTALLLTAAGATRLR